MQAVSRNIGSILGNMCSILGNMCSILGNMCSETETRIGRAGSMCAEPGAKAVVSESTDVRMKFQAAVNSQGGGRSAVSPGSKRDS
jgi:hypothetical protein